MADEKMKVTSAGGKAGDGTAGSTIPGLAPDKQTTQEEADGVRAAEGGTIQREPKPEDYPASAKVTPPSQQVSANKAGPVVGTVLGQAATDDDQQALAEAEQAHGEALGKAVSATQAAVDARREADEALANL